MIDLNELQKIYLDARVKIPSVFSKVLEEHDIEELIKEIPLATSERGWNLLHFLMYSDDTANVIKLYHQVGKEEFKKLASAKTDGSKSTPLTVAIKQKNWEMAQLLLELNVIPTKEEAKALEERGIPIPSTLKNKSLNELSIQEEYLKDLNALGEALSGRKNLSEKETIRLLKPMINRYYGKDVNHRVRNSHGRNLFHYVAMANDPTLLDSLPKTDTMLMLDAKTYSTRQTPLKIAYDRQNFAMALKLIEEGAEPTMLSSDERMALLTFAKETRNSKCIATLSPLVSSEVSDKPVTSYGHIQSNLNENPNLVSRHATFSGENSSTPAAKLSPVSSRFKSFLQRIENTYEVSDGFPEGEFEKLLDLIDKGADLSIVTKQKRNVLHYLYFLGNEDQRKIFTNKISREQFNILKNQEDIKKSFPQDLGLVRNPNTQRLMGEPSNSQAASQMSLHHRISRNEHELAVAQIDSIEDLRVRDKNGKTPLQLLSEDEKFYKSKSWSKYSTALIPIIPEQNRKMLNEAYDGSRFFKTPENSNASHLSALSFCASEIVRPLEQLERKHHKDAKGERLGKMIHDIYFNVALALILAAPDISDKIVYETVMGVLKNYENDFDLKKIENPTFDSITTHLPGQDKRYKDEITSASIREIKKSIEKIEDKLSQEQSPEHSSKKGFGRTP